MKNHNRWLRAAWLGSVLILTAGNAFSQGGPPVNAPTVTNSTDASRQMSRQEALIRGTYDKLVTYHQAARQIAQIPNSVPDKSPAPEFQLRDFHFGPIKEILSRRISDLVTLPSGEIIAIGEGIYREDNDPEEATYEMTWVGENKYSRSHDLLWTIGDFFYVETPKFADVREYASYEVTLNFLNRTRTYRALVLFRSAFDAGSPTTEPLQPEFWDQIVGRGGTLIRVWEQKRPPYGEKRFPRTSLQHRAEPGCQALWFLRRLQQDSC